MFKELSRKYFERIERGNSVISIIVIMAGGMSLLLFLAWWGLSAEALEKILARNPNFLITRWWSVFACVVCGSIALMNYLVPKIFMISYKKYQKMYHDIQLLQIKRGQVVSSDLVLWRDNDTDQIVRVSKIVGFVYLLNKNKDTGYHQISMDLFDNGLILPIDLHVKLNHDYDWQEVYDRLPPKDGVIEIWPWFTENAKEILEKNKGQLQEKINKLLTLSLAEFRANSDKYIKEIDALLDCSKCEKLSNWGDIDCTLNKHMFMQLLFKKEA